MPSLFTIDYILNAQLFYYRPENNDESFKYWVYTVKWYSEHGDLTVSREKQFHRCFQEDPSILELFWRYCKIDPEGYTLESSVITAPELYMDYCKTRGSASMMNRPSVESPPVRQPSPNAPKDSPIDEYDNTSVIVISDESDTEPQGTRVDVDSECESLFGDSFYVPRAKCPNGTPENVQISRKIFHNGSGKIVSKKLKMVFTYEQVPSDERRIPASNGFNEQSPSIDMNKMSSVVERTRTPDVILPDIEVLDDLPDYDEESGGDDAMTITDELESSSRHPTPLVNVNQPENASHDVEMAEPEPSVLSPAPSQKQLEVVLPIVDSDDEGLYVTHDHVIDPSTFIPISQLFQPQAPSSTPPPPVPPQNAIRHATATPVSRPPSPQNDRRRRAVPKTPVIFHSRLPLHVSIPPPGRSPSPPPRFPSFSLRLENDVVLPLHIKDDRSNTFKDFLEPATVNQLEPLAVHGYYLHTDYAKFVQSKIGIRVAIGYGRLWLDDNTETDIRQHWTSLRNDLNTKPLCSISLLPMSDEAFVIFSSLSYDFRDAINADKWSMGYLDDGLTIARVKLIPQNLPFAKQYRQRSSNVVE